LSYFFTFLLLFIFWKMQIKILLLASGLGLIKGLTIFLIIFSSVLLFNLLKDKKKFLKLQSFFKQYEGNKSVLIVMLAFYLVSFFEGIAGFGTPAIIVAPLLILFGFRAKTACILTLFANTLSVPFGAFATPLNFGIDSVSLYGNIEKIAFFISVFNSIIACFFPLILIFIFNFLEKNKKEKISIKKNIFFLLASGFVFAFSFFFTNYFFGFEFSSIVAPVFSFFVMSLFLFSKKKRSVSFFSLAKNFISYILLVFLLIASRINLFDFGDFLQSQKISFDFANKEHSFSLYNPYFLIFLVFFISCIFYKVKLSQIKNKLLKSFEITKNAFITLIFTLAFVQIIIFSYINQINIESIPQIIGNFFSQFSYFYLFISPFVGVFGAFLAGSATVSNLIFTNIQENIAMSNNLPVNLILSLQAIGAGIGNAVAIHNIVGVVTILGLKNESFIFKKNIKLVFGYAFIIGVFGFFTFFIFF